MYIDDMTSVQLERERSITDFFLQKMYDIKGVH